MPSPPGSYVEMRLRLPPEAADYFGRLAAESFIPLPAYCRAILLQQMRRSQRRESER